MQAKAPRLVGASTIDSLAPQYLVESVDNALTLLLLLGKQPNVRLSQATRRCEVVRDLPESRDS